MMDVLAALDAEERRRHEAVRAMLPPHILAEFDAGIEEIRSGRHELRNLWHTLSKAQRGVVQSFQHDSGDLWRPHKDGYYLQRLYPFGVCKVRAATVRALVAHRVLAFKGDPDPEDRAGLSGRGYALLSLLKQTN
jgi:hypothetical protein